MRKSLPAFLVFISIISCKNNLLTPAIVNNIPSGIIVKEKSISGNLDSVVLNISLFSDSNSTLPDSIRDNISGAGININTSRFTNNRFLYFGNDNILDVFEGDTTAFAVLFDDDDKISGINDKYAVNRNAPFYVSGQVGFTYDSDNRIKELPYYGYDANGGCMIFMRSSVGNFYTNSSGKDSLVVVYDYGPSCGACPFCKDTVIVNFRSEYNTTHCVSLSFPSMPSNYYPSSNDYLQLMAYMPFPKLNGKLIDKIYYSSGNIRYTNLYTFDSQGRVKTAKIFFSVGREKLLEFNY
jgi:hypothetical protein